MRNSCDHGIEPPAKRLESGKPETGTITVSASQDGADVIVTLKDDGCGLDAAAIKRVALKRGVITAQESLEMPVEEAYRLIFRPGFSTAEEVSNLSGRGVGMDVVKTNIEKLKGIIQIDAAPGKGLAIQIRLPVTLAILDGLLVVVDDDVYVIPRSSVLEIHRLRVEDICCVGRGRTVMLADGVLPIVDLNRTLDGGEPERIGSGRSYIVIIGLGEKRLGLLVDGLLGQEEVVTKPLSDRLGVSRGLSGTAVLGDGRVRLVVDPVGLFEMTGN